MDDLGGCSPTGEYRNALWQIQSTCLTFCFGKSEEKCKITRVEKRERKKERILRGFWTHWGFDKDQKRAKTQASEDSVRSSGKRRIHEATSLYVSNRCRFHLNQKSNYKVLFEEVWYKIWKLILLSMHTKGQWSSSPGTEDPPVTV